MSRKETKVKFNAVTLLMLTLVLYALLPSQKVSRQRVWNGEAEEEVKARSVDHSDYGQIYNRESRSRERAMDFRKHNEVMARETSAIYKIRDALKNTFTG